MTPSDGNRVLLMTGLWVPLIGHAPNDGHALAARLAARYPRANVTWHSWFRPVDADALASAARVALIGHSFGGDACVTLAAELARRGRRVEEMLLLDPVPMDVAGRWTRRKIDVPPNVGRARCIARAVRLYPRSKKARGDVANETCRIGHDDFLRDAGIIGAIEEIVRRLDATGDGR